MKLESLFLRIAVVLVGVPVLALCVFWLPWFAREAADHYPAHWLYPVVAGLALTAIPFFFALHHALKLLGNIDQSRAFSESSARGLQSIANCAVAIAILYAAMSPFLYLMADVDDAPGILAIGLAIGFVSSAIAVFAFVLRKLVRAVIETRPA